MKTFIIVLICLTGCRSTKTANKSREEMKRNVEMNTVGVKAAQKETNTVTYWPDGRVYQFEQMRERVDQVKSTKMDVEERQMSTRNELAKQRGPWDFWIYGGIVLALVVAIWGVRRYASLAMTKL